MGLTPPSVNILYQVTPGTSGQVTVNVAFDGIVVNNPYGYWIYFPDAGIWAPPRVSNFVFAWSPSPVMTVRWSTKVDPSGNTQAAEPNQTASFVVSNTLPSYAGGGSTAITVEAGTVVLNGPVTIGGGQNDQVNVSTDAPPVTGPTITIPAGSDTVTVTLHPPANATAIGFAFVPMGTYTLGITVTDALTLVELESVNFPAAGPGVTGRSITIPLTPGMTEAGITVTATAEAALVVATNVGYTMWYLGTNSFQPVNFPTQPLYVANETTQPLYVNAPTALQIANTNPAPLYVEGVQGATGGSLDTYTSPPQAQDFINSSIAAGASITLVPAIVNQTVRPRKVQIVSNAAEQLVLRSAAGGGNIIWVGPTAAGTFDLDFEGCATLGPSNPLLLQNVGTGVVTVTGQFTADQY